MEVCLLVAEVYLLVWKVLMEQNQLLPFLVLDKVHMLSIILLELIFLSLLAADIPIRGMILAQKWAE